MADPGIPGYPWLAVLECSTGYLTPATRRELEGWDHHSAPTALFGATEFGWFVWCPIEWDAEAHAAVPADLRAVLTWAREQGANYVLFDADGCATHEGLTWYGDEDEHAVAEPEEKEAPGFDPAKVTITRHRQSVTQQEVTVAYDGKVLWFHAGDDVQLCADGEYRGHDDAYWIEAARRKVAEDAQAAPQPRRGVLAAAAAATALCAFLAGAVPALAQGTSHGGVNTGTSDGRTIP